MARRARATCCPVQPAAASCRPGTRSRPSPRDRTSIAANACTTFSASGPNSCYVFTDRGTYDYLASGDRPGRRSREPEDRHSRTAGEHRPGRPVRADQLLPRVRAQPGPGAKRQRHRGAGLRQLPDLADGAERTAELPPDVGHGRSGWTAVRRHRQSDDHDHRAGDPGHVQGRQAGHDHRQRRQQGGRLPGAQRRSGVGRPGRQRAPGGGSRRHRDDRRERELLALVHAAGQRQL